MNLARSKAVPGNCITCSGDAASITSYLSLNRLRAVSVKMRSRLLGSGEQMTRGFSVDDMDKFPECCAGKSPPILGKNNGSMSKHGVIIEQEA